MEYLIICIVALLGSGLTLFSGFGLGTILLPVFGLFFPIEIAIILTAIVHFLNNILKLILFGKKADKKVVVQFGIPAILFAFLGAFLLKLLAEMQPLFQYRLCGRFFEVMPLKLIIGILLLFFALFDFIPKFKNIEFDKKYLPIGGALSGFFGGISGHQGALRTAFLIRANLTKESFIATGVLIACLIDVTRLIIYIPEIMQGTTLVNYKLLLAASLSAFLGVYVGSKLLEKTTVRSLQTNVAVLLFIFAVMLILGVI